MSETPPEFDLKFLPDWLKEGASTPSYANYEGGGEDRRGRGDRRDGGGRPFGPGGGRPGGGGDRRGPRNDRPGGPGGPRRDGPGGGPRRDDRRGPGGPGNRGGGGPRGREEQRGPRPPQEPRPPAIPPVDVRVEFLPEPNAAAGIARQIKGSGRAYPIFEAGRMFMDRPERHRVRINSVDPSVVLYQFGDGPIASDQTLLEKPAFNELRDQYYKEETTQGEPIKGNFSNVARSRATGIWLGPTNYHSYQPGLRRLYDERFSRRMSFQDFLYQDVEIRTDEQSINDWKEQARSQTTWTTVQEAEPVTFKSMAEVEAHFRTHYLRGALKAGLSMECSGQASREIPERSIQRTLRETWEQERRFPVQLINNLRPFLLQEGLHYFKHRKRVLFVSPIRPARHASGQPLSPGVEAILKTIESSPKCTRRDLAVKIIGANFEAPEAAEQKEQLARDLIYLIHSGQVIEFHDGRLDLPLQPGGGPQQQQRGGKGGKKGQPSDAPAAEGAEGEVTEADLVASTGEEEAGEGARGAAAAPAAEAVTAEASLPVEAAAGAEASEEGGMPSAESLAAEGDENHGHAVGELTAEGAGEGLSHVHEAAPHGGQGFSQTVHTLQDLPEIPNLPAAPEGGSEVPSHDFAGAEGGLSSVGTLTGGGEGGEVAGELHPSHPQDAPLPAAHSLEGAGGEPIPPSRTDLPAE